MGLAPGTWRRCGNGFGPWGTRRPAPGAISTEQQRIIQACVDGQLATRDAVRAVPVPQNIIMSYLERQHLTTRLTNAFNKKVENLQDAVSLYFIYHTHVDWLCQKARP
jgi:hypothetical protein